MYLHHARSRVRTSNATLQGYLAHKKQQPPRNLQQDYAQGPMAVLGGWAVSYERGTPGVRISNATLQVFRGTDERFNLIRKNFQFTSPIRAM